jgi:uncharacterized protein (TIGR02452 family)
MNRPRKLLVLPCLYSGQMALSRRRELDVPREVAAALGRSAVEAARDGSYSTRDGRRVVWQEAVQAARATKVSISPEATLPNESDDTFAQTTVRVVNETTRGATRRFAEQVRRLLGLNFANGVAPGGGSR